MELLVPLRRALAEQAYHQPTPVQAKTIPAALQGRDILGCAETGTGKTAAFALPTLDFLGQEDIQPRPGHPAVLVLAPTRELAIQIGESFATYGKHLALRQALVYGGVNQNKQVAAMRRGVHILIATPGRLLDLIWQKHVSLRDVEVFILDEADRMLDMGFLPALRKIIAELPADRQSLFFSATMPPAIRALSKELLQNPVSVDVSPRQPTVANIQQRILMLERANKWPMLQDLLQGNDIERAIVFTRTKRAANQLARKLEQAGVSAAAIHGNKSQSARQKALKAFQDNQVRLLVATDVASRGIDIEGVTHVINFDIPVDPESYVHRIGRTGRAGATGIAITFCTSEDRSILRDIEQLIRIQLDLEYPFGKPNSRSTGNSPRNTAANPRRSQRPRRSSHGRPSQQRRTRKSSLPAAV